jgi:hypothetical protein
VLQIAHLLFTYLPANLTAGIHSGRHAARYHARRLQDSQRDTVEQPILFFG